MKLSKEPGFAKNVEKSKHYCTLSLAKKLRQINYLAISLDSKNAFTKFLPKSAV